MIKASPNEAGCWISGSLGIYAIQELITIAAIHGYITSESYKNNKDKDSEVEMWEADEAEDWLNDNVAPEGYQFGWADGEFFLMPYMWWMAEDI